MFQRSLRVPAMGAHVPPVLLVPQFENHWCSSNRPLGERKMASTLMLFSGVSKGPSMPLEPEPDVDKAPSPPSDPPGSPEPADSANLKSRTSKRKSKVEA